MDSSRVVASIFITCLLLLVCSINADDYTKMEYHYENDLFDSDKTQVIDHDSPKEEHQKSFTHYQQDTYPDVRHLPRSIDDDPYSRHQSSIILARPPPYEWFGSRASSFSAIGAPIHTSGKGSGPIHMGGGGPIQTSGPGPIFTNKNSNHGSAASAGSFSSFNYEEPYTRPFAPGPLYPEEISAYNDEHNSKKVAVAIAVPLAVILGPLVIIGLIALFNFRALLTVAVVRSLCENRNFFSNYVQLCLVVGNIGKRSVIDEELFNSTSPISAEKKWMGLHKLVNTEKLSKVIDLLSAPNYNHMDHLNDGDKSKEK